MGCPPRGAATRRDTCHLPDDAFLRRNLPPRGAADPPPVGVGWSCVAAHGCQLRSANHGGRRVVAACHLRIPSRRHHPPRLQHDGAQEPGASRRDAARVRPIRRCLCGRFGDGRHRLTRLRYRPLGWCKRCRHRPHRRWYHHRPPDARCDGQEHPRPAALLAGHQSAYRLHAGLGPQHR